MADVRVGDHEAVGVDRITGIGHQHGVAGPHGGQRQMRQAFLGADGDDGFGFRVQAHVVAALVPVGDRLAQTRNALGLRIAVRVAALGGLGELVDDVLRGGLIRIAHAEIDDVLAARTGRHLQLADDVEDIGGQALDALKVSFHGVTLGGVIGSRTH